MANSISDASYNILKSEMTILKSRLNYLEKLIPVPPGNDEISIKNNYLGFNISPLSKSAKQVTCTDSKYKQFRFYVENCKYIYPDSDSMDCKNYYSDMNPLSEKDDNYYVCKDSDDAPYCVANAKDQEPIDDVNKSCKEINGIWRKYL